MKTKAFALTQVKAIDDGGSGSFESVLSAPTLDRDEEVVDFGALAPLPNSIPILADHEGRVRSLVARATPVYENGVLKVLGKFASHEFAQFVRQLVKEGMLDTMSVGFLQHQRTIKDGVVHITKGELLEGSFVVIPSNREALISAAKSLDDEAKQYVDVEPPEGSYEDTQEDVLEGLRPMYPGAWVSLIATYPTSVVYAVQADMGESETYSVTYALDETTDEVTFGTPVPVEVMQVVSARSVMRYAAKAGRRNSNKDQAALDAAHDAIVTAGANCPGGESTADEGAAGDESKDAKLVIGLGKGTGFDMSQIAATIGIDLDMVELG